jgi:cytochrome c-type biogenesis protein CcmH/NrfG
MARPSSSRSRRGSHRLFVFLAVVVIGLLVVGSVAAIFTSAGDGSDEDIGEDPSVRITPGAEVGRLETEVARNPEDADAIVVLAEVLANSGRVAESVPWYERAVSLRPDDVPLRIAFGRALQRNQSYFDAEVQLLRALDIEPEDQSAAFYLASLYEQMPTPRINAAVEWYQVAVDADPDSVIAGQARARLAALGEPDASPTAGE